jgi:hypothetical protein
MALEVGYVPAAGEKDPARLADAIRQMYQNVASQTTADDLQDQITALGSGGGGATNHVHNGTFSVAQRGTSFSSSGSANNDDSYTLDRWIILSDGNDIADVDRDTADVPTNGLYACKLTVQTVDKKFGILQIVEQKDCQGLIGETVTLSAYLKVNNATRLDKIKMAILSWDSTADTVTSDIVSAWGTDGTTPTMVANWTLENTPADLGVTTSWARYSVSAAIDTASTKNIGIFIWSDNVTDTDANDTLHIADVQLEYGSSATRFVRRPYAEELAICQRFYWRHTVTDFGGTPNEDVLTMAQAFSTTGIWGCPIDFPVTMRVAPTSSLSAIGHFSASNSVAATDVLTAGSFDRATPHGMGNSGGFTVNSAIMAAGNCSLMQMTNTGAWVAASADL